MEITRALLVTVVIQEDESTNNSVNHSFHHSAGNYLCTSWPLTSAGRQVEVSCLHLLLCTIAIYNSTFRILLLRMICDA
jgi:hypothetical protein